MNREAAALMRRHISQAVSLLLWDLGVVKINLRQPFKLVSGNFSPIYINCRQVISSPNFIRLFLASAGLISETAGFRCEMVAGGETAGIPFAAFLARELALPMLYVRKAAKGHGLANLVEGGDPGGKQVLLVEDLITDGGSKLHFIQALRSAGGTVEDALVLFDRRQGGEHLLAQQGVKLHSVADLDAALETYTAAGLLSGEELSDIQAYRRNPAGWHKSRGLEYR